MCVGSSFDEGFQNQHFSWFNGMNGNGNGNGKGKNGKNGSVRVRKRVNKSYGDAGARVTGLFHSFASDNHAAFMSGTGFIEAMMDPDAQDAQRFPDGTTAGSAIFKSRNIFDLPFSGQWDASGNGTTPLAVPAVNGSSTVIIGSGTRDCIFSTRGGASTVLVASGNVIDNTLIPTLLTNAVGGVIQGDFKYLNHPLKHPSTGTVIIPRLNGDGIPVYELLCESKDEFVNLSLRVKPINSDRVQGRPEIFMVVSSQVTPPRVFGIPTLLPWDGTDTEFNIQVANPFYAFYLYVFNADISIDWAYSMTNAIGSDVTISTVTDSCQVFDVDSPTDLSDLSKTVAERTTSQSLLASYVGSSLSNGGVIAAARLPRGMSPVIAEGGDYYKFISSLPAYADDFPLQKGIYTWRCPDSIEEFFFHSYGQPQTDLIDAVPLLFLTCNRDNPEQGVRVSVVNHFEVLTRSNLYMTKVGPVNVMLPQLLLIAKLVPAVAENPSHKQILGRVFNKIIGFVKKPSNWQKIITGAAQILG